MTRVSRQGERSQDRRLQGGPPPLPSAEETLLVRTGGHGGSTSFSANFWLTPLPPSGRTLLVVRCPAVGLPETTIEFDAAPLHDAARQVTVLWPPMDPPGPGPTPRPPDPPTEGWFAVRS